MDVVYSEKMKVRAVNLLFYLLGAGKASSFFDRNNMAKMKTEVSDEVLNWSNTQKEKLHYVVEVLYRYYQYIKSNGMLENQRNLNRPLFPLIAGSKLRNSREHYLGRERVADFDFVEYILIRLEPGLDPDLIREHFVSKVSDGASSDLQSEESYSPVINDEPDLSEELWHRQTKACNKILELETKLKHGKHSGVNAFIEEVLNLWVDIVDCHCVNLNCLIKDENRKPYALNALSFIIQMSCDKYKKKETSLRVTEKDFSILFEAVVVPGLEVLKENNEYMTLLQLYIDLIVVGAFDEAIECESRKRFLRNVLSMVNNLKLWLYIDGFKYEIADLALKGKPFVDYLYNRKLSFLHGVEWFENLALKARAGDLGADIFAWLTLPLLLSEEKIAKSISGALDAVRKSEVRVGEVRKQLNVELDPIHLNHLEVLMRENKLSKKKMVIRLIEDAFNQKTQIPSRSQRTNSENGLKNRLNVKNGSRPCSTSQNLRYAPYKKPKQNKDR